jgi:hypothetical protein
MDTYFDICGLEPMGLWVMRMEHEMNRNKKHIFEHILVERTGFIVAVLQSINMSRDEGFPRQHPFVQALLVDLEAFLRNIDILDWNAGLSSLLRLD